MKRKISTSSRSVLNSGLTEDYRKAIAEYIWNGFDAGATCVEILYTANPLGGVDDFWLTETLCQLDIAHDIGYITDDEFSNEKERISIIGKQLSGLRASFQKQLEPANR